MEKFQIEVEHVRSIFKCNNYTVNIRTQPLILHQMLTFEGDLNLRKIEADSFVTVTLHQPKR